MRLKRNAMSLTICLLFLTGMLSLMTEKAYASEDDHQIEKDGVSYFVFDDSAYVVGFNAWRIGSDVSIPSVISVDGANYKVVEIVDAAFYNCETMQSVIIPDSVDKIGRGVFWGCAALNTIEVSPDNMWYCSKDGVLYSKDKTKLIGYPIGKNDNSFVIPDSVTKISSMAFMGCTNLKEVIITDRVTAIGVDAFYDCSSLEQVILPNSLRIVEGRAFYGCSSLAAIALPNGLTRIDEDAFKCCLSLSTVWVPKDISDKVNKEVFPGLTNLVVYSCEVDNIPTDLIYDGTDQAEQIKGHIAVSLGENPLNEGETYKVEFSPDGGKTWGTSCVNTGTYQFRITGCYDAAGFVGEVTDKDWTFGIYRLSLEADTVSVNFGDQTFTYNGTDQKETIESAVCIKTEGQTLLAENYEVKVTASEAVEAGEYQVKIAGRGECTGEITEKVVINKASGLTVSLEDTTYEYGSGDAEVNSPSTNAKSGKTTFSYSFEEDGTYTEDLNSIAKTKAGTYTLYVKASNPNYSDTASGTATLEITKRRLTITADSDTKEYDGTALTKGSYTNTDLVSGDKIVSVTVSGSQTIAGHSNNVPSAAKIVNADEEDVTDCYEIAYVSGTLTIIAKPEYNATEGVGSEYTRGSGKTLTFVYKRTADDETTFERFTGMEVDGKAVPQKDASGKANWTAKKGSLILELQPSYLDTLSAGDHTVRVVFDDGETSSSVKILEENAVSTPENETTPSDSTQNDENSPSSSTPNADSSPATSDSGLPMLWAVLIILSVASGSLVVMWRRKAA